MRASRAQHYCRRYPRLDSNTPRRSRAFAIFCSSVRPKWHTQGADTRRRATELAFHFSRLSLPIMQLLPDHTGRSHKGEAEFSSPSHCTSLSESPESVSGPTCWHSAPPFYDPDALSHDHVLCPGLEDGARNPLIGVIGQIRSCPPRLSFSLAQKHVPLHMHATLHHLPLSRGGGRPGLGGGDRADVHKSPSEIAPGRGLP